MCWSNDVFGSRCRYSNRYSGVITTLTTAFSSDKNVCNLIRLWCYRKLIIIRLHHQKRHTYQRREAQYSDSSVIYDKQQCQNQSCVDVCERKNPVHLASSLWIQLVHENEWRYKCIGRGIHLAFLCESHAQSDLRILFRHSCRWKSP